MAIACASASGAMIQACTISSTPSSEGQPNQAPAPCARMMGETAGLAMAAAGKLVLCRFQPPCAGAARFARRATVVAQSLSTSWMFTPSRRIRSAVTRPCCVTAGKSVGFTCTTGSPPYPASRSAARARSIAAGPRGEGGNSSAFGRPQGNMAWHSRQSSGSATAVM